MIRTASCSASKCLVSGPWYKILLPDLIHLKCHCRGSSQSSDDEPRVWRINALEATLDQGRNGSPWLNECVGTQVDSSATYFVKPLQKVLGGWSITAMNGDQFNHDSCVFINVLFYPSFPTFLFPRIPLFPKLPAPLFSDSSFGETQDKRMGRDRMGLWSWVSHLSDVINKFFTDGKQMLIALGIQAIFHRCGLGWGTGRR